MKNEQNGESPSVITVKIVNKEQCFAHPRKTDTTVYKVQNTKHLIPSRHSVPLLNGWMGRWMPKSASILNAICINRDHMRMAFALVTVYRSFFLPYLIVQRWVGCLGWVDCFLPQGIIQRPRWAGLLCCLQYGAFISGHKAAIVIPVLSHEGRGRRKTRVNGLLKIRLWTRT